MKTQFPWRGNPLGESFLVRSSFQVLIVMALLPALAGSAAGQARRLSLGAGASFGAFHACPSISLAASFPIKSGLAAVAEFAYSFNPAEDEKNPPQGYHRSSAGLELALAGIFVAGNAGNIPHPYVGAGVGWLYLSTLTDRPPAEREILSRNRFTIALLGGFLVPVGPQAGLGAEARWLFLSGGEGRVLRFSASAYIHF